MPLAALLTWMVTAAGGLYLLTIWLIEYDREFQSVAATRLPVPVISTHALLAVTGLGCGRSTSSPARHELAWLAAGILVVVAILGLTMAARWIGVYRAYGAQSRRAHVAVPVPVGAERRLRCRPGSRIASPERHFPLSVVILHGVFAVATVVLVLLTALSQSIDADRSRRSAVRCACGSWSTSWSQVGQYQRASTGVPQAGCRGASAGSACLAPQCASRRSAPASSLPSAVSS